MTDAVLTLNAGSSSVKFALYEIDAARVPSLAFRGQVEGIGSAPRFSAYDPTGAALPSWQVPPAERDFAALLTGLVRFAEDHLDGDKLAGVGHRVVHGGPDHYRPELATPVLLATLESLTPLAPLHLPHNLAPIRALALKLPGLPQVLCFDTAFHHSMPSVATRFALPREYEAAGVRRYGFHGLSYEYVARRLAQIATPLARGRVIVAHLGNGASLCAMHAGRSIDTTMGFTALDGLVMGTRCGSIDPGVILYLEQQRGLSPARVEHLLYEESGLLGVSGLASDMRDLLASAEAPAREAVELFVFRIAREVGALTSSLGGLDGLVFTAGIGEHAPEIRSSVCDRLGWLGVALDDHANSANAMLVSTPQSRVAVHVIPTDEEAMIAQHTLETIAPAPAGR